jgi:hypothetical protein
MVSKKQLKKQKLIKFFAIAMVVAFFGSIISVAILYSGDGSMGGSSFVFSESQYLMKDDIYSDIEVQLMNIGIVFIETGNSEYLSLLRDEIIPEFSTGFMVPTQQSEILLYPVYVVENSLYLNEINMRTSLNDTIIDNYNKTVVMDFVCDNINPQFLMNYDYCIIRNI